MANVKNYQIRQFKADVNKWINQAGGGLEEAIRLMLMDVNAALILNSPVDTGRFRGNWQVSFDKYPLYALNNYDKSGQKTIAENDKIISTLFRNGAAVTNVYFSNMLIYANALEYGHSKQAPAGVVGLVAIRMRSMMTNAILRTRG